MKNLICMAALGSALLAASAMAADSDEQAIRSTLAKAVENWEAMNVDANDAYYAPDANAMWFDISPLKYVGWNEYKVGVKKVFANFQSLSFKLNDDMAVQRRGKVAWVTYTFSTEIGMKDGKSEKGEGRGTDVLEKRGGKWLIVHEHVSFPAPM
jgi:DNA phosphorothioation-dependent restriction protein DptG